MSARKAHAGIDALSRMYLAVNDLICVSAIDDYENRKKITHKINALYRVIDRTSASGLRRMYRLTKESTLIVYGIKRHRVQQVV